MTEVEHKDDSLIDSIKRLNTTAKALSDVLTTVTRTQETLVKLQRDTDENTDAITLRSTKQELLNEVVRIKKERKQDKLRSKLTVGVAFFISTLLIGSIWLTTNEYKNARKGASLAYSTANMNVCEQRSSTWAAMQKWIATQRTLESANISIDAEFKAKRIAALDKLLESFPTIDCRIGSVLTSMPHPTGLGTFSNEASR